VPLAGEVAFGDTLACAVMPELDSDALHDLVAFSEMLGIEMVQAGPDLVAARLQRAREPARRAG
jgi:hypothetical protein